jgi:Tfp pilus assembly protein PilW
MSLGRVRDETGLTLIELMIASFLALLVAMGIGTFQASISQFFRQGSERLRLQQNVHRTAQVISIDVRKAADFKIYDPADPATELVSGPAVELKDAGGSTINLFRASRDGHRIQNGAGQAIDDMRLTQLWFESDGPRSLRMSLGLADRYGNESEVFTEISTRAPRN